MLSLVITPLTVQSTTLVVQGPPAYNILLLPAPFLTPVKD